jgi:hypothetical protein
LPHKSVKINLPQIVHEAFDDEVVIVNLDSGNYYSLEGPGAEIWQLIEKGADSGMIASSLENRYDGSRDDIDAAVTRLLDDLESEKIVTLADSSGANGVHPDAGETGTGTGKPRFTAPVLNRFTDMQELLLLDPVHDVDETGWPRPKETAPVAD